MQVEEIIADINKYKKELESLKNRKARAEGAINSFMDKLKTDHGIKTVEQLRKEIEKAKKRKEKISETIESEYDDIKKKYKI